MLLLRRSVARAFVSSASAAPAASAMPSPLVPTMRVNRLLALSGACSRREGDAALAANRVRVNGSIVRVGARAPADCDLRLDGKRVTALRPPQLFLAYKAEGEIVTREGTDDQDRSSVFTRLNLAKHIAAVGRLDVTSEGLMVFSTCGALARALEHPKIAAWERRYRVHAHGLVTANKISAMRHGLSIDGVRYAALKVKVLESRDKRSVLEVACTQGKNRMIRNICDHLRLRVSKLVRVQFGPFSVDQLAGKADVIEVPVPADLRQYAALGTTSSPKLRRVDDDDPSLVRLDAQRRGTSSKRRFLTAGDDWARKSHERLIAVRHNAAEARLAHQARKRRPNHKFEVRPTKVLRTKDGEIDYSAEMAAMQKELARIQRLKHATVADADDDSNNKKDTTPRSRSEKLRKELTALKRKKATEKTTGPNTRGQPDRDANGRPIRRTRPTQNSRDTKRKKKMSVTKGRGSKPLPGFGKPRRG